MKIKYRSLKGYKYQLTERYCVQTPIKPAQKIVSPFIRLGKGGSLQILKGYAWDGCSGPTWDDKKNMRGGLVHDACYQLLREGYLGDIEGKRRKIADQLLREICIEDGMSKIRAWYYYHAVRLVGGVHLKTGLGKKHGATLS